MAMQRTVSPVDGRVYVERELASAAELEAALARSVKAQRVWRAVPLGERIALCQKLVEAITSDTQAIAEEITWQIGRPLRDSPGEMRGFADRARYMLEVAPEALADVQVGDKAGFHRFIRHEPLGVVLVLAPWNYPYLTSVNAVLPALVAGNAVLLKHSDQTPLCAERYSAAARAAGLPEGLLQHLCCTHDDVAVLVADPRIDFVAFTGSVQGGHAVSRAAGERFVGVGLELGGKDPAYVRADADLDHAVPNLVDGVCFNSGQSCCAVERVYVHRKLYDEVVERFVALTRQYVLGNPLDPKTTLGPLVRTRAAELTRAKIAEAKAAGARALIEESAFAASKPGTPYLAPQVLVDVNHGMRLMREETFAPVIGIMAVSGDEEAVRLMNDSAYGLTASIWTRDEQAALVLGDVLETGTVFMNRCDYLDPALAWTGVKDSGRGCTLSKLGYGYLSRPKSFHLRL
ncbi:MAG: aldehyde dehydrogenase family protein [Polyangiales bacterium]